MSSIRQSRAEKELSDLIDSSLAEFAVFSARASRILKDLDTSIETYAASYPKSKSKSKSRKTFLKKTSATMKDLNDNITKFMDGMSEKGITEVLSMTDASMSRMSVKQIKEIGKMMVRWCEGRTFGMKTYLRLLYKVWKQWREFSGWEVAGTEKEKGGHHDKPQGKKGKTVAVSDGGSATGVVTRYDLRKRKRVVNGETSGQSERCTSRRRLR